MRSCVVCGRSFQPSSASRSRCPAHALPSRGRHYTQNAKRAIAGATHCHLCGGPFNDPRDPPVADHVVPRSLGGSDELDNLRPAHRSCNGSRGTDTKWELWRQRR